MLFLNGFNGDEKIFRVELYIYTIGARHNV